MESHSCSSDDEIWSYSPLTRMSKRSERETIPPTALETAIPCPKRTRCLDSEEKTRSVSRQCRGAQKKGGKDAGSSEKKVRREEGYCPFCQMPFRILVVQSASWHVSECLGQPMTAVQECPSGLDCDSTIQSHYRKYRHSALAALRSGVKLTECPQGCYRGDTETRGSQPCQLQQFTQTNLRPTQTSLGSTQTHLRPARTGLRRTHELSSDISQSHGLSELSSGAGCDYYESSTDPQASQISPFDAHWPLFPRGSSSEMKLVSATRNTDSQEARTENGETSEVNFVVNSESEDRNDDVKFYRDVSEMLVDATEEDTKDITTPAAETGVTSEHPDTTYDDGDTGLIGDVNTCVANDALSREHSQVNKSTNQHHANRHDSPLRISVPVHHGNAIIYSAQSTQLTQSPRKQRSELNVIAIQKSIDAFFKPMKSRMLSLSAKEDKLSLQRCVGEVTQQQLSDKSKLVPLKNAPSAGSAWNKTVLSDVPSNCGSSNRSRTQRKCPFYKWIPGTVFTVDAFSYGVVPECAAYFLSHFHYDHYMGLKKSFAQPIYCSQVTANLVRKKIGVDVTYLNSLPLDTVHVIKGVKVTFIDANHCPGSVMILFQLQNGQVILHTGDFRANSIMEHHLVGIKVNQLFLDTTYCDPSYSFPPQDEVIRLAVTMSEDYLQRNPKGLIVVGSYTIGKERLFLAIAEAVNCHICVTSDKKTVLVCLDDTAFTKRLTLKSREAKVHVLPMSKLSYSGLCDYLDSVQSEFDSILAFQPTGWTHTKTSTSLHNLKPKIHRRDLTLYGLPYSEHSSYLEMKRFVQFLEPNKIIPTVNNGNPTSRNKMEKLFHSWRTETRDDPPPEGSKLKQTGLNGWLK